MAYNEGKLSEFSTAIAEETDSKIKVLEQETNNYEITELKKTKDEAYGKMFTYMQEQVRLTKNKYRQSVTKYELESRRDLLEFRNSLTQEVFDKSMEKLAEFAKCDKYEAFMLTKLETALKELECEKAVLVLSPNDERLFCKIKSRFSEICEIRINQKNHIGGFCLINEEKKILIDETFAAQIEGVKQGFYKDCGLSILL